MADQLIVVSNSSYKESGCVNCGCDYCYAPGPIVGGSSIPLKCGQCETLFIIVTDGLEKSTIGFPDANGDAFFHPVQEHPRKGIEKHPYDPYSLPDARPEVGEYWKPRGPGYGKQGPDLAGFVRSKIAGERILKMVQSLVGPSPVSYLDWRPNEPRWIQFKIEEADGFDVEKLHSLCCDDGIITEDRLKEALKK